MVIRKGRLNWFVHLECKDIDDLFKGCTVIAARQRRHPNTTWWDDVQMT